MNTIEEVIKSDLCIGCGICSIDQATNGMKFSKKNDCFVPANTRIANRSLANKICPGKGYQIIGDADKLYSGTSKYDIDLGYFKNFTGAHSTNKEILQNASSGGVLTSLLIYLLQAKIVERVSVTKFICDTEGVRTKTFLTSNISDILSAQGSKYCPTNVSELLEQLTSFKGKVAVVGTPCVIAGIRNIQKEIPSLIVSKIELMISNFCGGFKSYRNIRRLAEIHNMDYKNLKHFRFRGGGQPGSLRCVSNDGIEAQTPYPKYVGLTGQSKMYRCHVCVDATGELADISCGDAWIPRFENDENPWSVVLTRSTNAFEIINAMAEKNLITTAEMTIDEVKLSQRFNLKSKKTRQASRMKLYRMLGYKIPSFDGGYHKNETSIKVELNVFAKHKFKLALEHLGIYLFFYRNLKK